MLRIGSDSCWSVIVPESFERESEENYNGPTNGEGTAVYGKRNSNAHIESRQRRLFKHQLTGECARALVYEHASREGVSLATAWRDWAQVCAWNDAGWEDEKETILSRIQNMRMSVIQKAIKKGQLQTAIMGLKDLEGQLPELHTEANTPTLNISIEAPGANNKTE